jgi:hypothetical protein
MSDGQGLSLPGATLIQHPWRDRFIRSPPPNPLVYDSALADLQVHPPEFASI